MGVGYNPSIATSNLTFCTDSFNSKSYSVNVFGRPLDVFNGWNTSVGVVNCTCIRDTTVTDSPAGGIPMKMTVTGNDPYYNSYNGAQFNLAPAAIGQTWTVSAWAKADRATYAQLFMMAADGSGAYINAVATNTNIGTTWQRISATFTLSAGNTAFVQCRLDGPDVATAGTVVWWDGVQVERASTPSTFNPIRNINNTTLNDVSYNGNNLTIFQPVTYANNSFTLGTNGYLSAANKYLSCENAPNVSYAFVINFNWNAVYGYKTIFGIQENAFTYVACFVLNTNASLLEFDLRSSGTVERNIFMFNMAQYGNQNVLVQYTFTAGTHRLYMNDTLVSTYVGTQTTFPAFPKSTGGFAIGNNLESSRFLDSGTFSWSAVYNKALSQAEISQNYNALRGRYNI